MEVKTLNLNGDCLVELPKLIEQGVTVDLILCDPPYGTTACEWDLVIDESILIPLLYKVLKMNGKLVIFGNSPFYDVFVYKCIKGIHKPDRTRSPYFYYTNEIIWLKNSPSNPLAANKQVMRYHEKIIVLNKASQWHRNREGLQLIYNPYTKTPVENQKMTAEKMTNDLKRIYKTSTHLGKKGQDALEKIEAVKQKEFKEEDLIMYENYPKSYFMCPTDGDRIHPTQKPTMLLEHLIKLFSNEGMTVLDFTMGSGSTGVACKKTNRNFIGIEMDKHYFDIAVSRMENLLKFNVENQQKKNNETDQMNIFELIK